MQGVYSSPAAWDGLLMFWCPAVLFSAWIIVIAKLFLTALKHQRTDGETAVVEADPTAEIAALRARLDLLSERVERTAS